MPTAVNFTTLQADIRNYLERGGSAVSDPTVYDQIPRLINAAERKIMQLLKLQGMIEVLRDPTGLPANMAGGVLTKPDRWRQTVSMHYGIGTGNVLKPLFPRSYEYCRAYWPDATLTAPPEFYAEYELSHWLIVPTPDVTYPLEVISYMQPPLLDDANQTNFFTNYTPNMMLYGGLLEAAPFLKDDSRIPTWENFYQVELVSLSGQDLQKVLDRMSERSRV